MTETVTQERLAEIMSAPIHPELRNMADNFTMNRVMTGETLSVVDEFCRFAMLASEAGVTRQSDTRIEGGGEIKAGDTVRILRARNASGEDVYALTDKPYQPGETFVVGEIQDEGTGYPCRVVFPVGEHADFWREDDLALEPPPPANKSPNPEHVEGDVLSVGEMEVVAWECTDLILGGEPSVITDVDHAAMRKIQPKAWTVEDLVRASSAQSRIQRAERERDWALGQFRYVAKSNAKNWDDLKAAEAQLADAVKVLEEMVDTLTPAEYASGRDPAYGDRVRAIGSEIGFGALMSCASTEWRLWLEDNGYPVGSEFVSGPCRSVLQSDLRAARAFLSTIGEKPDAE